MTLKKYLFILSVVILPCITTAQMEGDQWVMGYWGTGGEGYSIFYLDFKHDNPWIIQKPQIRMNMDGTAANICTADGESLIWTNGMQIMGYDGKYIADTIAYDGDGNYWKSFYSHQHNMPDGFPELNGALILPLPGHPKEYSIIYHYAEPHPVYIYAMTKYLEARVAWNQDSTFELKFKDVPIGERVEWYTYTISAVRHANGRDWWILTSQQYSPKYFTYLLDSMGIHLDHIGEVDSTIMEGLGQALFSNSGKYFVRLDAIDHATGQFITLFDFDRCTGDLHRKITLKTATGTFSGVAFSPSERYLYADNNTKLWQWDLWAKDIRASQILVDTFDGFNETNWGPTRFGPMVSAPDGRIYIVLSISSSKYLHVIDRPDLKGKDCRFKQHTIHLHLRNERTAPNIPNYRLGPLDESECDTLGLDNLPVARWRFEEDQPGFPETIRFVDLSHFDPEFWHWDFGDDQTSDVSAPVHQFEPGLYHVCLTVSNQYATDSTCRWVEILPTGIKEEQDRTLPDISIAPNPFHDFIMISSRRGNFRSGHMQLYDMYGRIIYDDPNMIIPSKIFLPDFPSGIYLCNLTDQNGSQYSYKLMKE